MEIMQLLYRRSTTFYSANANLVERLKTHAVLTLSPFSMIERMVVVYYFSLSNSVRFSSCESIYIMIWFILLTLLYSWYCLGLMLVRCRLRVVILFGYYSNFFIPSRHNSDALYSNWSVAVQWPAAWSWTPNLPSSRCWCTTPQ